MAFKCIGRESILLETAESNSIGDRSLQCEEISGLIAFLNDKSIREDVELTSLVDDLFYDWVVGDTTFDLQSVSVPPKKRREVAVDKRTRRKTKNAKASNRSEKSSKGQSLPAVTRVDETLIDDASEGSFEEEDILGLDLGVGIDPVLDEASSNFANIPAQSLSKGVRKRLKSAATTVNGATKKKTFHCINGCGGKFNTWSRFLEHVRATGHML